MGRDNVENRRRRRFSIKVVFKKQILGCEMTRVASGQVWSVLGFRLVLKVFRQGGTMPLRLRIRPT